MQASLHMRTFTSPFMMLCTQGPCCFNPDFPKPCSQGQGAPAVKGVRHEVGARLVGRGRAVRGQHDVRAGDAQLPVLRLQRDDTQRGGVGLRACMSKSIEAKFTSSATMRIVQQLWETRKYVGGG